MMRIMLTRVERAHTPQPVSIVPSVSCWYFVSAPILLYLLFCSIEAYPNEILVCLVIRIRLMACRNKGWKHPNKPSYPTICLSCHLNVFLIQTVRQFKLYFNTDQKILDSLPMLWNLDVLWVVSSQLWYSITQDR